MPIAERILGRFLFLAGGWIPADKMGGTEPQKVLDLLGSGGTDYRHADGVYARAHTTLPTAASVPAPPLTCARAPLARARAH